MKLLSTIALGLAVGLSAPAFAEEKKAEKPAEKVESKEVDAESVKKWLAFFDEVVATVVKYDKTKCDAMGTDLDALFTKNTELIKVANEQKAKGLKLPKAAQDQMLVGVKKMGPMMKDCMKNAKVTAAFKKFDGKDGKK